MTELNFPVYDADNHLYEPPEAFLRHLPKQFQRDFRYVDIDGRTKLLVDGKLSEFIPNPTFEVVAPPGSHEIYYRAKNKEGKSLREITGKPLKPVPDAFFHPQDRIKVLDEQGVHAANIFPTLASVVEERLKHKPESIAALFHSLNQWILEEWTFSYQDRMNTVPFVNLADVDLAVKELEFILENGGKMVGIRPAPVPGVHGGRSPGFEEFDPFWARVAEARIPVMLHASDSGYDFISGLWTSGNREYLPFQADAFRSCVSPGGRAIADTISALICHGLFERHPDVRVASIENGSKWVKPLLNTYEHAYGQMPQAFKVHPVEQFHKHVFVAPFYEESITDLKACMPVERILFGSDYPHAEGLARPLDFLNELEGIDDASIEKIMSTNMKGLLEGVRD